MRSRKTKSQKLFDEACAIIPGGVQSPVRAFQSVGGTPPFVIRGERARITDADGNEYIDYVGSWGPLILGHAAPKVIKAIRDAAILGTSFGAPTPSELELARLVTKAVPSIEMVRFVSSGTEATMSAVRLARAYTGREKILKFEGCYHGHGDAFLVKAGSGLTTLGIPASPGVPRAVAELTLNAPYNDLQAVQGLVRKHAGDLAAVIVEPVAGNMGVVLPNKGFLEGLREITKRHGILLIFDEVITGFRVGLGGAQKKYGVVPDLTTLGKILGGGLPVGAYGGSKEIMKLIAPSGPVYQAGTLSGNPLAMVNYSGPDWGNQDQFLETVFAKIAKGMPPGIALADYSRTLPSGFDPSFSGKPPAWSGWIFLGDPGPSGGAGVEPEEQKK